MLVGWQCVLGIKPLQLLTIATFVNKINRHHILCQAMGYWIFQLLPPFWASGIRFTFAQCHIDHNLATAAAHRRLLDAFGCLISANFNGWWLQICLAITVLLQIASSSLLTCLSSSTAKPKYCQNSGDFVPNFAPSSILLPTCSLVTSPQSRWLTGWLCATAIVYICPWKLWL